MAKIIYLKPEQEITSLIGYLWQAKESNIVLIAPKNSSLIHNAVALKILKREADNCEKEVIFVVKGPKERETLEKVGFKTRPSWPKDEGAEFEDDGSETSKDSLLGQSLALRHRSAKSSWRFNDIRPSGAKKTEKKEPAQEIEMKEESEDLIFKHLTAESPELAESNLEIPKEGDSFKERAEKFLRTKEQPEEETFEPEPVLRSFRDEDRPRPKKKFSWPRFDFSIFSFKFLSVFLGAALLLVAGVLYFVLPRAEINIFPKTEPLEQSFEVSAEKGSAKIDLADQKIPAQFLKIEKSGSKEFAATGKRQFNEKARGVITVFNEYSSSPQTLVSTTRFISEDGHVFRTAKTITVPGAKIEEGKIKASSIDVEVVADQAGFEYNIEPAKFTIPGFKDTPKYTAFYGRSKTAMTGGAVGEAKIVSQDDFNKAKEEIWKDLETSLDKEIKLQIPGGLKLLDNALKKEIVSLEPSVEVGGRTEKFSLTVKGAAKALILSEDDLKKLIEENLAKNSIEGEKVKTRDVEITYKNVSPDFDRLKLAFEASVSGKIVWQVDEAAIKNSIAKKNLVEIKNIFDQHQEIERAQITLWPFWVKEAPSDLNKIKIIQTVD